jgi:hypothetical protein
VVSDAIAEVERIYARVALDLPREVRREMVRFVEANRREQRPPHAYTLEEFGLDADAIRREFADYRKAYVLPRTPGARV